MKGTEYGIRQQYHTFTKDQRFREFEEFMIEESKKGEVRMCTLLDAFEKKGTEKGEYRLLERYARSHNISIEASMEDHGFSEDEKAGYYAWVSARTN